MKLLKLGAAAMNLGAAIACFGIGYTLAGGMFCFASAFMVAAVIRREE